MMMIGQPSNEFKSSDTLDMPRRHFLASLAPIFDTHIFFQSIFSCIYFKASFLFFFFCRADELTRRKMMSAKQQQQPQPGYSSPSRKISPPNYPLKNSSNHSAVEEPDPGQLLNEWLGELDNLQKVGYYFEWEFR